MAYAPHTLVTFGGRLASTVSGVQEIWQCGIRLRIQLSDLVSWGGGVTNPATYMAAIASPLSTWFHTSSSTVGGSEFLGNRSDAYLDWLKVNNIGVDGKYADKIHTNRYDYATPLAGGAVNSSCPPFVTLAVSLTTASKRGPGHRGRIYLPLLPPLSTNAVISTLAQTQANGTVKALLNVLKAPSDTGGTITPVVASGINAATNPITGVACGQILDVQRRRKNKLPEGPYVSSTWP